MKKGIWVIIGAAILTGSMFTLWDYKQWRRAELENYGHGYNDVAEPALKLTKVYQNTMMRVRTKYPDSWEVKEELPAKEGMTQEKWLVGGKRIAVASWQGGLVTLWQEKTDKNLSDFADFEVNKLNKAGINLSEERSYIRQTTGDWQVLTWKEGADTVRMAITVDKGVAIIMQARAATGTEWNKYEKTIEEMTRSVVVL